MYDGAYYVYEAIYHNDIGKKKRAATATRFLVY